MCKWMYFTGSACVHRPEAGPQGVPRPFDERKFMHHGVWSVVTCHSYYARKQDHGTAQPCPLAPKPDYYQMTRDMLNPGYELVDNGYYPDGSPDFRCPRCRGTEPQSRRGREVRYPRQPDWNARR